MKGKHNKWDKKSTIYLIAITIILGSVLALIIGISSLPEYLRNNKAKKYDGETTGIVKSIKGVKSNYQNLEKPSYSTPFYTVSFTYKVQGKEYSNDNNLQNKGKYKIFINQIYESDFEKEIAVKYMINNPQKSMIIVE